MKKTISVKWDDTPFTVIEDISKALKYYGLTINQKGLSDGVIYDFEIKKINS